MTGVEGDGDGGSVGSDVGVTVGDGLALGAGVTVVDFDGDLAVDDVVAGLGDVLGDAVGLALGAGVTLTEDLDAGLGDNFVYVVSLFAADIMT